MATTSLRVLIASILAKPDTVQRRVGALVGSVVADAASQHLQWVYDQDDLTATVGDSNPEFWSDNKCPYFNLSNGKSSCYGDEVLTTLESVALNNNSLDVDKLYTSMQKKFIDPETPYQVALAKRPEKKYPIDGPWLNGGLIKCFENYAKGIRPTGCADNHDADGLCLAMPVIIQKFEENFETNAKNVVQVLTTNDVTVAHNEVQAKLIQAFINGEADPVAKVKADFAELHPDVVAEIEDVEAAKQAGGDVQPLVKRFGLSCSLPGSFQSALVSLLGATSFESGVRSNMMGGGDCCSRSIVIGACLGAKFGLAGIPIEWIEKVDNIEEIIKMADQIMQ